MTEAENTLNDIQNLETKLRRAESYAKKDDDTIKRLTETAAIAMLKASKLERRVKELGGEQWPLVLIVGKDYSSRLRGSIIFKGLKTGSEMYSPIEVPYFKHWMDDKGFFIQKHDLHLHFNCAKVKQTGLIEWMGL